VFIPKRRQPVSPRISSISFIPAILPAILFLPRVAGYLSHSRKMVMIDREQYSARQRTANPCPSSAAPSDPYEKIPERFRRLKSVKNTCAFLPVWL
jgi:hypothetical protein